MNTTTTPSDPNDDEQRRLEAFAKALDELRRKAEEATGMVAALNEAQAQLIAQQRRREIDARLKHGFSSISHCDEKANKALAAALQELIHRFQATNKVLDALSEKFRASAAVQEAEDNLRQAQLQRECAEEEYRKLASNTKKLNAAIARAFPEMTGFARAMRRLRAGPLTALAAAFAYLFRRRH